MKLMMELLSDALPGSGEGLGGIIDVDVNYDEYGLPYIPAKRLKGILREAASDLRDVGKLTDAQVTALFGQPGQRHGAIFRLSDGYLPNYEQLRAFLSACARDQKTYGASFYPQSVLGFYTYTRSQTAIEEETPPTDPNQSQPKKQPGVAKEGSLRTFRVLKKGIAFEFECEPLPEEAHKQLQLICAVTRRFGSSRTRGLGDIRLRCGTAAPRSQKLLPGAPRLDEKMSVRHLNLQTQGQVLVTTEVGQDQVSEAYLPGSFLLGALADAYIQIYQPKDINADETFRAIFLNGGVRFGNAYPLFHDNVYFPAPLSIVKEKDSQRHLDLVRSETDKQTKGGFNKFIRFDRSREVHTYSPEKEIEYHHYRPEEKRWLGHAKEEEGQFFQFEALAPHQSFQAKIVGKEGYLDVLQELLKQTRTLFLGKSKTAQYGKCTIIGSLERFEPPLSHHSWKNGEILTITLESDLLLRNKDGLIVPDPKCFRDEFVEQLAMNAPGLTNAQVRLAKTFLKTKQVGGFLTVWNLPKIQGTAIAAGSVIVLQNNSGHDLALAPLEHAAFGLRTEEGFGCVKFDWHGRNEIRIAKKENGDAPLFAKDLTAANTLISHMIAQRIQAALNAEIRNRIRQVQPPTNAFLGRLRLFLIHATTCREFQHQCSALQSRGRDHLMKLHQVLLLNEQNDGLIVELNRFMAMLKELAPVKEIYNWPQPILTQANITIDHLLLDPKTAPDALMDDKRLFKWYQEYALYLLTQLKLKNRKKEGSNREE